MAAAGRLAPGGPQLPGLASDQEADSSHAADGHAPGAARSPIHRISRLAQPWGSELEVRVTGIAVGTRCQLWVTGAHGQDIAAGGWTIASASQHGWYPASVPFPAGTLRSFEVTAGGRAQITVPAR
jgi:hypothetical protein